MQFPHRCAGGARCAARPGTRRGAGKRRAAGWQYRCTPRTASAMWCAPPRRLLSARSSVWNRRTAAAVPAPNFPSTVTLSRLVYTVRAIFSQNCTSRTFCPAGTLPQRRAGVGVGGAVVGLDAQKLVVQLLSKWSAPPCRPRSGRTCAGRRAPHWRWQCRIRRPPLRRGWRLSYCASVFSQNCTCSTALPEAPVRSIVPSHVPSDRVPLEVSPSLVSSARSLTDT